MRCGFHLHSAQPGKLLKRLCFRCSAAFCHGEQALHLLHCKDTIPASLDCSAHAMMQIRRESLWIQAADPRPVMIFRCCCASIGFHNSRCGCSIDTRSDQKNAWLPGSLNLSKHSVFSLFWPILFGQSCHSRKLCATANPASPSLKNAWEIARHRRDRRPMRGLLWLMCNQNPEYSFLAGRSAHFAHSFFLWGCY